MALNPEALRSWVFEDREQSYTDRETMLYALSVGFGADPLDPAELRFVYERDLLAVPTLSATLCHLGPWIGDPRTGATRSKVVHGEQRMTFHAPLPASGRLLARSRIAGVEDKGPGKGALVHVERRIHDADSSALLVTSVQTSFCRADGGFAGSFGATYTPHVLPQRSPDLVVETTTREDAALLYRLNVDRNPLHVDPDLARQAGYARPILHGLCTYGIVARLLLKHAIGYQPERLRSLDARFSSAVMPGDTLGLEIWRDGNLVSFRASVNARAKVVLDNGRAEVTAG
ncbi:MAG: MaoC/PaaZ C-terminal domain-containing protein [Pseudomonadota bacterium]